MAPVIHLVMPPWDGLGIHRTFGHQMPPMALLVLADLARREGWAVRCIALNYDLYQAVFEPARMTRAQLQDGLWEAYRRFYSGGTRWRRWRRHVATRLHPLVGTTVTLTNFNYAHSYRPNQPARPCYEADPGDIEGQLTVSSAPASDAMNPAVRLLATPRRPAAPDPHSPDP